MVGDGRDGAEGGRPDGALPPLHVHALIDNLGAGGAELLLAEFAAGAADVGIELTVGYLHERDANPVARARLERFGVHPGFVPVTKLLNPADIRRVRAHLAEVSPDIVHTHLDASDFVGGLAARTLRIPSVSTLHAMEWTADSARDRLRAQLVGRARRRFADRVIAVSEAARERYLAGGWDAPERVTTIYNGISGLARPGAGAAVRERLGLAPEDLVVGMLSTVRPEKGHDVALAALAALKDRFPALRLVVVGGGPALPGVRELAAPLGQAALLVGHQEDVMAVLDAFDVLLHPSYHEAFPTALLEAMAASVPVVASGVGGIPEIVGDGVTGLLIEAPPRGDVAAAALERLLADPEARRRMGAAGRERFLGEFTARVWARRTRSLYDELVAARGGGATGRPGGAQRP